LKRGVATARGKGPAKFFSEREYNVRKMKGATPGGVLKEKTNTRPAAGLRLGGGGGGEPVGRKGMKFGAFKSRKETIGGQPSGKGRVRKSGKSTGYSKKRGGGSNFVQGGTKKGG